MRCPSIGATLNFGKIVAGGRPRTALEDDLGAVAAAAAYEVLGAGVGITTSSSPPDMLEKSVMTEVAGDTGTEAGGGAGPTEAVSGVGGRGGGLLGPEGGEPSSEAVAFFLFLVILG